MGLIQDITNEIKIKREASLKEVRNKIGNTHLSKLPAQDIVHHLSTILGGAYIVPELQDGITTRTFFNITCSKCGKSLSTCIGYICTSGICDCEIYSHVDFENLEVPYTVCVTEQVCRHAKSMNKIIHKRYREYRKYLGLGLSSTVPELFRIHLLQSVYEGSPYTFTNEKITSSGETHTVKQYCKVHNTTHIRKFREVVRHGASACCVKHMLEKQVGVGRGRKITDDFFKKQLHELYPSIRLISPYKAANEPATFYCETCGHVWDRKPASLIRNTRWGCPNCHKIEIESKPDDTHAHHIKHKIRKELIKEKYNKFIKENPIEWKNGYKCMTTDYFIAGVKACRDDWDNYSYDKVNFLNQNTKVTITCKKHGDFQILPNNFRYGQDCPRCAVRKYNISSGEQSLMDFFEENKIEYEFQKKFKDCKDKKVLPFDFMIKIGSERILVEYDGVQHFIDVPYWNKSDALGTRKRHDDIKTKYASANGIPLYRITLDKYVTDGWMSMEDFKKMVLSKI